jgi:hypothetical protein
MEALYEITDDYLDVMHMDVETEDDLAALNALLDEIGGRFEEKAKRVALYRRTLEGEAAAIKAEEERLYGRRKALDRKAEGLKVYLATQMHMAGIPRIDSDLVTLVFQKNPPAVNIVDRTAILDIYLIPQEPTVNKKMIAEILKSGMPVPGAELVQSESLRIK